MATFRTQRGKFQAIIRRVGHKDLYKTFTTKKEAVEWATLREAEILKGELLDFTESSKTSFIEVLDRYLDAFETQARYPRKLRSQLKVFRDSNLASLSVKNVTPKAITQFRNERLKKVSAASVVKDINKLSAIFNWLIKEEFMQLPQGNPVTQVVKPRLKADSERRRRLTPEEAVNLSVYFHQLQNNQMSFIFQLALFTGMRRGEIANILLNDFMPEKGLLVIPQTKNGYERTIPLPKMAYLALHERLKQLCASNNYESISKAANLKLFDLQADSITQAFSRACKKLGIKDLRWHDLRHEAISRLFEAGLDMIEVALISGHRDMRMLQRYTHLRPEAVGDKLRLLSSREVP